MSAMLVAGHGMYKIFTFMSMNYLDGIATRISKSLMSAVTDRYFLNLFGLRGLFSLILGEENGTDAHLDMSLQNLSVAFIDHFALPGSLIIFACMCSN
jgi:hypothetical protein